MYKCYYRFFSLLFCLLIGLSSNSLTAQIDANSNKWFTNLKDALSEADRVYKLDLSGQGLTEIPKELSAFPNLNELRIMDNLISTVGTELSENTRLESLDLSGNQIESIDFNNLSENALNLKFLILRENSLEEIDASINKLKFLTYLDLGGNFINDFDDDILLKYLKVLVLDNNSITEVPKIAINSPKLKTLNLNSNQIEIFDVRVFQNLKALDLGDNPLKKYNITISILEKLILDWVDFSELELYPLPVSIEILSLEHCGLKEIPEFVYKLYKLQELSVMHNDISKLNDRLNECVKLKQLWIDGNSFDALPESKNFNFSIK